MHLVPKSLNFYISYPSCVGFLEGTWTLPKGLLAQIRNLVLSIVQVDGEEEWRIRTNMEGVSTP